MCFCGTDPLSIVINLFQQQHSSTVPLSYKYIQGAYVEDFFILLTSCFPIPQIYEIESRSHFLS